MDFTLVRIVTFGICFFGFPIPVVSFSARLALVVVVGLLIGPQMQTPELQTQSVGQFLVAVPDVYSKVANKNFWVFLSASLFYEIAIGVFFSISFALAFFAAKFVSSWISSMILPEVEEVIDSSRSSLTLGFLLLYLLTFGPGLNQFISSVSSAILAVPSAHSLDNGSILQLKNFFVDFVGGFLRLSFLAAAFLAIPLVLSSMVVDIFSIALARNHRETLSPGLVQACRVVAIILTLAAIVGPFTANLSDIQHRNLENKNIEELKNLMGSGT